MKKLQVAMLLLVPLAIAAKTKEPASDYFYVYQDRGAPVNHYIPSGWMGSYGDLKFVPDDKTHPVDGQTAIKITYDAQDRQGAGWAGIYWQQPSNNWGNVDGGFNLNGYKKLTFWARGEKGNEKIAEFKMGGITGTYSDSGSAAIGPIVLTQDWKHYTIDIKGQELSKINGGFCYSASKDDNPQGFTIYLDEIRYEK